MNSRALLLLATSAFLIIQLHWTRPIQAKDFYLTSSQIGDRDLGQAALEYYLENVQLGPPPSEVPETADVENVYLIPENLVRSPPEYQYEVLKQDETLSDSLQELVRRLAEEETHEQAPVNGGKFHDFYISEPINQLDEYKLRQSNLSRSTRMGGDGEQASENEQLLKAYMSKVLKKLEQQPEEQTSGAQIFTIADETNANTSNELDGEEGTPESRYGTGEYIDHPLALVGHQYVQGGAGEGRQLLGPEGTFENVQVVKTDHGVPSYCNPPNPCPIGFTAEDGCLEKFVNSASFSREYQAKQKCSCDNEHSLFNCAAAPIGDNNDLSKQQQQQPDLGPLSSLEGELSSGAEETPDTEETQGEHTNKLIVLARTIENRFGNLASVRNLISDASRDEEEQEEQLMITKKDNNNMGTL